MMHRNLFEYRDACHRTGLPPRAQLPRNLHVSAVCHMRAIRGGVLVRREAGPRPHCFAFGKQQRQNHFACSLTICADLSVETLYGADETILAMPFR